MKYIELYTVFLPKGHMGNSPGLPGTPGYPG